MACRMINPWNLKPCRINIWKQMELRKSREILAKVKIWESQTHCCHPVRNNVLEFSFSPGFKRSFNPLSVCLWLLHGTSFCEDIKDLPRRIVAKWLKNSCVSPGPCTFQQLLYHQAVPLAQKPIPFIGTTYPGSCKVSNWFYLAHLGAR